MEGGMMTPSVEDAAVAKAVQPVEHSLHFLNELTGFSGRLRLAALSKKQPKAYAAFEVGNQTADGRLGNVESLRRSGDGAVTHDEAKCLDLPLINAWICR